MNFKSFKFWFTYIVSIATLIFLWILTGAWMFAMDKFVALFQEFGVVNGIAEQFQPFTKFSIIPSVLNTVIFIFLAITKNKWLLISLVFIDIANWLYELCVVSRYLSDVLCEVINCHRCT